MQIDQLPCMWAAFDVTGRLLRVNRAMQRRLAHSVDPSWPGHMRDILSVESSAVFDTIVVPTLDACGEAPEVVLALRLADGSSLPVQCQFEQIESDHIAGVVPIGPPPSGACFQVVMQPILGRVRFQEELRRTVNAVEQAPGAVFQLHQDHAKQWPVCTYLSSEVMDFMGVTRMALKADARALLDVIDPSCLRALLRKGLRTARRGGLVQHQFQVTLGDGRSRWIGVRAEAREQSSGAVDWYGHLADVSDERQRSEKMLQSQRMEAIGTMAGGIAHDFNNLLAAILGNVAIAQEDAAAGRALTDSLADIDAAARSGRDLVRHIMMFSRRQPRVVQDVDMVDLCREALRFLKASLPATAHLSLDLPPDPVVVQGDAIQLQQVLINLCSNACHALPDTGGEIRMRLTLSPASSGERQTRCTLQVIDNGCGMTAATLAQVFNPFFTTKEVGKGTGLGLSVVHGIVQDHGGSIDVHSTVGSGSTFDVHLPCRMGPGDATSHRKGERAPATQGRGRTVVFIDDNPLMARLAQRALARAGFRAEIFTDPQQALEWLETPGHRADAVITDVNMPGMNGISLCRHITQRRPELPVVITSGAVTEELMQQAHQAGATALIPKEQAFGSLLQAVEAALALEPARPDLKS